MTPAPIAIAAITVQTRQVVLHFCPRMSALRCYPVDNLFEERWTIRGGLARRPEIAAWKLTRLRPRRLHPDVVLPLRRSHLEARRRLLFDAAQAAQLGDFEFERAQTRTFVRALRFQRAHFARGARRAARLNERNYRGPPCGE